VKFLLVVHSTHDRPRGDVPEARCVATRDGRTLTTDGPFHASGEQPIEFIIVECDDIDEATRCAATLPEATCGVVEVRAVRELSLSGV
jgi:hypothetical protein